MVKGTMEEKLYQRQIIKQAMSDRSFDVNHLYSLILKKAIDFRCD